MKSIVFDIQVFLSRFGTYMGDFHDKPELAHSNYALQFFKSLKAAEQ
jgi:hypothetical protein